MPTGEFARNLVQFSRLLRAAGMRVGPDRTLAAIEAVQTLGVERREDVHAGLSAVLISRREEQSLFDAAFDAFWRDPRLLEGLLHSAGSLPAEGVSWVPSTRPARLDEALAALQRAERHGADAALADAADGTTARLGWSDRERLRGRDFESMSVDEFRLAQRLLHETVLPLEPVTTRRTRPASRGALSLRDTLTGAARNPLGWRAARRAPRSEPPPLVVLCDVSGSMDRYARIMLSYAHALLQGQARVNVFTFGTRLTEITRDLRHRDPDEALASAARAVTDWQGGTRIGPCLDEFVQCFARRVLTGRAAVLLVTDGLDRAEDDSLARAAARLSRFTRQFVWLNPLLRFEGFEPRASGVRALLPHVDHHLPVHSLDSLADLSRALRAGAMPKKPGARIAH